MDNGSTALPYWKDYQGNAIRGVIAAVCCAVFFILLGLVYKFRWRSFRDDDDNDEKEEISGRHNVAYNRDAEDVRISKTNFQSSSEAYKRGMANSAMDSSE